MLFREPNLVELLENIKDEVLELTVKQLNLKIKVEQTADPEKILLKLVGGYPIKPLEASLLPIIHTTLLQNFKKLQFSLSVETNIKAHLNQLAGKGLRGVKNVIAIASGKGGVGKSTVTVNLATALAAAGARVGILDADLYGPSIPLMLGKVPAVSIKDEHYLPVLAHNVQAMSIGYLIKEEQALIWRGPMLAKTLLQMLNITLWDKLDYLFIDLPPGTGDIALSLVQKIPITGAIVVTTPQNIATIDADKAIIMFKKTNINVLGIIENMAYHFCQCCKQKDLIFGEGGGKQLANKYNIPLLGSLPINSQIRADCDNGIPTAANINQELANAFCKAALRCSIEISKLPVSYVDVFPKIVQI